MPARMAMIAMTTKSSIRVKPRKLAPGRKRQRARGLQLAVFTISDPEKFGFGSYSNYPRFAPTIKVKEVVQVNWGAS
jgi:hypothetical protein